MNDQPERYVFMSHVDFVRLTDLRADIYDDVRVQYVPVPLIGEWAGIAEIVAAQPVEGTVLLRDLESGRLVPAETHLRTMAMSRVYAFIEVCHALGATSLGTHETSLQVSTAKATNELLGGVGAGLRREVEDSLSGKLDFSTELDRQIRSEIQATARFSGGDADIAAAREVAGKYAELTGSLRPLIDMRAKAHNVIRDFEVHVDFLSAVQREVDLIFELERKLQVALSRNSALTLSAALRNQFHRSTTSTHHHRLSMQVSFES